MIPRKQRASQHDWLEAVEAIYSAPDLARARRSDSIWQGWMETHMIDPALVETAAERGLPEAADFLRHLENR